MYSIPDAGRCGVSTQCRTGQDVAWKSGSVEGLLLCSTHTICSFLDSPSAHVSYITFVVIILCSQERLNTNPQVEKLYMRATAVTPITAHAPMTRLGKLAFLWCFCSLFKIMYAKFSEHRANATFQPCKNQINIMKPQSFVAAASRLQA